MSERCTEFDEKGCYSWQKIRTVTIPILLSMIMEHIIGMTDTIFLGRVSEVALGASALGTVYFLAFFVLGTGFSFGAQILIARRNGEKNYRKTGQICYASGFFLAIFSLLTLWLIKYFSPICLPFLIQSKDVCAATIEYLDWRSYGLFFVFMTAIIRAFYVGIAQTRILTYSSIIMVLSNIVLNYGLIFGKYGLPEMGIGGAALASSVAEGLAMICYIFYTAKYIDLKKYGFDCYSAIISPGILKKVFSVSFWMMLQPFLSVGVWFVFFIAVERLGERTLAVVNLGRAISALPFILIHAFATTTNSLVSNLIGEGRSSQFWRLIRKITLAALIVIVPLLLVFVCIPELCLRIYTDNMPLIADSINIVYVVAIASFIQIFAFILFNAVTGTGAIKMIVFIEFVNLFIYLLFVWLVVIRMRPSPAVTWNSEVIYQAVTVLFCLFYLLSGKWKKVKL
ncbi:MAG: MATE family efflux transporter [Lentisphaeria bacterium]|nr:MATE family efflux transporter [Lentisphaeria bacterium]